MTAVQSSVANAFETTLSAEMGPNDLTASVASVGTLVTPCWLVIEMDSDSRREYIWFDGTFGGSSFVTTNIANRYKQGSAAGSNITHPINSLVRTAAVAGLFSDIHERINAFDHGNIGGLSGDDHPQYPLVDGSRDFTAPVGGIDPVVATDLSTKSYVDAQVAGGIPAGMIMPYGGAAAPGGYLMCDGAEISRATYNDLYLAIGTAFGSGNGTTTFDLPDLQDRSPMGANTTVALGDTGGTASLSISHSHTMPSHTHTGPSHSHTMPTHIHTMPTHTHSVPTTGASGVHDHALNFNGSVGTLWHSDSAGVNRHNFDNNEVTDEGSHTHSVGNTGATDPGNTNATDPGNTNAGGTGSTGSTDPGDTNSAGGSIDPLHPVLGVNYVIKT